MPVLVDAFASAWRPEDKRPATEWGAEFVKVPGSARAERFDPSASPWLVEPMNLIPDNRNKEIVVMMPTGGGKTTLFDVLVPRAIVEDPGSILLTQQTRQEAQDYWAERIEPTLMGVPDIRDMINSLPRGKKKKGMIAFPHLTFYCVPANVTELQRKSVRWVFFDEAWMIAHGLMEQGRARTHDRWNQRVVVVSQGGVTHVLDKNVLVQSELDAAWRRTDMRQNTMVCPDCGDLTQWGNRSLLFEDDPEATFDSLDETAVLQSARYKCSGRCGIEFADKIDIRRALSTASIYRVTNPKALARHVGFHTTAHALFHIAWGQLALEWKKASISAKFGDNEARKIYIQKRLAENWRSQSDTPTVVMKASDYSLREFEAGELWEGETFRFFTIDRQLDHWWGLIRAWRNDGSSRLIWCGRLATIEEVREKQLHFKVQDRFTFEDASEGKSALFVYDDCLRFGWKAVIGTKQEYFIHIGEDGSRTKHLYAKFAQAGGLTLRGKAWYVALASDKIKDLLAAILSGRLQPFEHAIDAGEQYERQMRSETKREVLDKKTNKITMRWCKIHSRTPNHLWDCEAYQVALALMAKLLHPPNLETHVEEETPPIDTPAEASG